MLKKQAVRKLYREGFTNQELAIMFKKSVYKVASITRGIKRPERI